jgi:hypothetical protein
MTAFVTKWQCTWKADISEDNVLEWIVEMSAKGWELKGYTVDSAGKDISSDAWATAVMQRPIETNDPVKGVTTWTWHD